MSERLTRVPLFVEIAESLKEKGVYQHDFSESGIAEIMGGVITSLISNPEAKDQAVVVGGVDDMEVKIRGQRGTVSGNVQVNKPMEVKIPVKFVLKNSTSPENLKLDQISIGSGFTKFALGVLGKALGVDVEAEARAQLKDPNKVLTGAFSAELLPQGVKLTGVGLHFKDDVLSVSLKGEAVNQQKPAKAPEPAKPPSSAEASPADKEWMRKRGRVRRYLEDGNGMDFLKMTYKDDLWAHIGEDGSVKQTYRPLKGVLAEEGLCLRENVREKFGPAYASASEFRRETKFLESVKGPHFVRVYARAPYDKLDSAGFGQYRDDSHWELVDFADGTVVDRKFDREHDGSYWPDQLTPAVRLRVLLAACENEFEALSLSKPAYIADLKTDAFILGKDGETIKQVDCQIHDESVDYSHQAIATELVRLCLELFPANARFSSGDIEKAIGWYLRPERYTEEKKWFMHGENPPTLTEIINLSRHNMPIGLDAEILGFLNNIRDGNRKVIQVPMNLFNRILPIAQRTEREESQARAEKLAAGKREEVKRRALKRVEEVSPEQKANLENVRQATIMIFESDEEELNQIVAHYYADRFANNPELGRTQLFADTMHTAVELGIVLGEGFVFERKGPPEKIMSLIQHYNADQKPESARFGLSFLITFMNSLSSLQRRKIAADSFQDEELPKLFVEQFYANVFYSYWAKSKGIK